MKTISTICFSLLLSACSSEQVYDAIQENRRMECTKLPQQQYEDCMKENDTSYEDYERDRQDLEKEKEKEK